MSKDKGAKGDVKAKIRRLADVVQREIDSGADSVEKIHRSIARMPLDALEKLDVFTATVKDVRKVQDASIGAVYDVIHQVNHEVAKLAKEMLAGRSAPTKAHSPKMAAKRPARASAPSRPSARL